MNCQNHDVCMQAILIVIDVQIIYHCHSFMYIIYRCSQTTKDNRNPETVLFWGHAVIYFDSSEAGEAESKGKALHVSGQGNSSVVVPLKHQNVSDPQKAVRSTNSKNIEKAYAGYTHLPRLL